MADQRRFSVWRRSGNPMGEYALLALVIGLAACSHLGYYGQAASGQVEILSGRRPIEELLANPDADADLRAKLAVVAQAREFAVRELRLPDSGSFKSYVDLDRRYVVWNVFATPELSLQEREWCYPIAGCIGYRAYFSEERARAYAGELHARGEDVYVAGVRAYSTLGWFADPVYSPLLDYSETELAGVLFHELAHERLYIPGDTAFNESFAMTIQLEGTRRWLEARGASDAFTAYLKRRREDEEVVALLLRYREQLEALYAGSLSDDDKRQEKAKLFAALRAEYEHLKLRWGGDRGYDRYFAHELNNASLTPIGTYHRYVPALRALLAKQGGALEPFYAAAETIGKLPPEARVQRLQALQGTARAWH